MRDHKPRHFSKIMAPQPEGYVDSAPATATSSIVIDAPVSKVWAVLDDTPGFVDWFPGVRSASMVDPLQKGLKAKRLAQLNRTKYYEEIVAYRKNEAWGFTMLESTSGVVRSITEVIYLSPVDDSTTNVTYKGGFAFAGAYRFMSGVIIKQISRIWADALAGLKNHVES